MSNCVVQTSSTATVAVDPDHGCRIASLAAYGHDLIVPPDPDPIAWGIYPMAPWAGRVRKGRFSFRGSQHRLPINLGDHAIHGTVFTRAWTAVDETTFTVDLGPAWPFAGRVRQEVRLEDDALHLRLEVNSDAPMPASCGWHPWFRRRLDGGPPVRLDFSPGFMMAKDHDAIPTGERVPPPPGPWDDCFGGLSAPPRLTWPGALRITVETSCQYFVVYDERSHAVCVEPQTAPPDVLNRDPFVVEPDRPLVATATLRWQRDGEG